jgi:tetratricopeptide (TPR) repeat protein
MEARSILRSIQNVFPQTTLWMHSRTALIVARKDAPVQVSIQDLSRRLQEPALAGEYSRMKIQTVEEFLQLFQLGPEGVRELVAGAPPVTDDDPSLEFHPPRSQIEPLLGGKHILDWWLTTLKIYEIREHQALPIAGASPREALAFQASFRLRSLFLEGNLWLDAHRHREAERYFQEGLSMSSNPFDRGEFLFRLALTAQEAGNQTGAMDLVARSLEASPGKATALALQRELLSGPR